MPDDVNIHATAAMAVSAAPFLDLPGVRLAMLGRIPGERLDHRRGETLMVNPSTRRVVVIQHIQLVCGHVLSAPYLEARGFG